MNSARWLVSQNHEVRKAWIEKKRKDLRNWSGGMPTCFMTKRGKYTSNESTSGKTQHAAVITAQKHRPQVQAGFVPSPHCALRSLVATAKALWYQLYPTSKTVSVSRIEHETWWNMMKHLAVLVLVQYWQDPGAFRGCTTHTLWGGSNSVITPGPRRATCGQPESLTSHNDNLYLYHFFIHFIY